VGGRRPPRRRGKAMFSWVDRTPASGQASVVSDGWGRPARPCRTENTSHFQRPFPGKTRDGWPRVLGIFAPWKSALKLGPTDCKRLRSFIPESWETRPGDLDRLFRFLEQRPLRFTDLSNALQEATR